MNDEKETPEFKSRKTPLERLGENLEVLKVDFDKMKGKQEDGASRLKKANSAIDNLRYDLANPKREYGYTPTREVAVAALKQSRGFISVENLEGHKVIKDLDEQLNKYVGQANMKFNQLRREISNIPSPDNMHDLLNENFKFNELNNKVKEIEKDQEVIVSDQSVIATQLNGIKETYNGNDHPTGPEFEAVEMDYEELRIRHNDLVHFLKGVFSSLKLDPVAKCIEEYKIKTQTENKDNEKPIGTSNESE